MKVMKDKVIAALDFTNRTEVSDFLAKVGTDLEWVKVGMELYYGEGPDIVRFIKDKGYKVFLDLKLHDIPNTVDKATQNLLRLDIDMLNFHAAGGSQMLSRVAKLEHENTLFIAVTQLTSTSEKLMQEDLWIERPLVDTVLHYTEFSLASGMNGVVCSPLEVEKIKTKFSDCITVCPGIRLKETSAHDQIRFTTPAHAVRCGADYLVIGRTITGDKDPHRALHEVYKDMENA